MAVGKWNSVDSSSMRLVVLPGLAGGGGPGIDLTLRFWTSTHQLPLANYESAGDRLVEGACVGKWRPGEALLPADRGVAG